MSKDPHIRYIRLEQLWDDFGLLCYEYLKVRKAMANFLAANCYGKEYKVCCLSVSKSVPFSSFCSPINYELSEQKMLRRNGFIWVPTCANNYIISLQSVAIFYEYTYVHETAQAAK